MKKVDAEEDEVQDLGGSSNLKVTKRKDYAKKVKKDGSIPAKTKG